jgi:hypothetical protein
LFCKPPPAFLFSADLAGVLLAASFSGRPPCSDAQLYGSCAVGPGSCPAPGAGRLRAVPVGGRLPTGGREARSVAGKLALADHAVQRKTGCWVQGRQGSHHPVLHPLPQGQRSKNAVWGQCRWVPAPRFCAWACGRTRPCQAGARRAAPARADPGGGTGAGGPTAPPYGAGEACPRPDASGSPQAGGSSRSVLSLDRAVVLSLP